MNFEKMETTIKDIKEAQKETDRLLTKMALEADRRFEQITLEADRRFEQMTSEANRRSKETDRRFEQMTSEADRRSKETDRRFEQMTSEADRRSKETDRRFEQMTSEADRRYKETSNLLKQIASEADKRYKEAEKQFTETQKVIEASQLKTDKYLRKMEGKFTSRWGRFVESLVTGQLVNLLKERGIDVSNVHERIGGMWQNKQYEFDIIAKNGADIVIVEVKTKLDIKDVKKFLAVVKNYKQMRSDAENKNIYAAVAYLYTDKNSIEYAAKKGLFVIQATGSSASILNKETFKPKNFSGPE